MVIFWTFATSGFILIKKGVLSGTGEGISSGFSRGFSEGVPARALAGALTVAFTENTFAGREDSKKMTAQKKRSINPIVLFILFILSIVPSN